MAENNWSPKYVNDSRPGLLSDGSQQNIDFKTTQRADFGWPQYSQGPYARRKKVLKESLFNEITEDFKRRMKEVEDAKIDLHTTYGESYKGDGFDVRDLLESADPQKMAKYPLYSDQAYSIYFNKIKNYKQKSVSNDPQACFRRYSYFSKPFYAELEEL